MRWEAPDGTIWASRFEYGVFLGYRRAGIAVRKCGEQDRVDYTSPVRNATCGECGASSVATAHGYTPDLFIDQKEHRQRKILGDAETYFAECKGYLRGDRRSLLRALCKARPDLRLRFIIERDYKVTKQLTIAEWITKYLRRPVAVWTGDASSLKWRFK